METQRPELKIHSTPKDERVYLAHAVNLRDMRLALQRIAGWFKDGQLKVSRANLERYAENYLAAKIGGCEAVQVDGKSRTLRIRAVDANRAAYEYATSFPPEWPL
jgi:hypothetical protein